MRRFPMLNVWSGTRSGLLLIELNEGSIVFPWIQQWRVALSHNTDTLVQVLDGGSLIAYFKQKQDGWTGNRTSHAAMR